MLQHACMGLHLASEKVSLSPRNEMNMLTYALDERGTDSLYSYLYRCIRHDIEVGLIPANEKLPSKRSLAKHLGVSLITVEGAYTQLVAEGYVRAVQRKGYYANCLVMPSPQLKAPLSSLAYTAPKRHSTNTTTESFEGIADFSTGAVAGSLFPFTTWTKILRDVISHEPQEVLLSESPAAGCLRLREALVEHLRTFRGLEAQVSQIVVGAGAQTLYNFIVQLLGRTNCFAVEDPGYARLTQIYNSNDVSVVQVPVNAEGIDMISLKQSPAQVVHLMPSHQFPTGIVTTASRRFELLAWAAEQPNRYLIEDDYDCEFRLSGRPIPPMKSLDTIHRVIYMNTFSRSLGPAFRMGYLVLPLHLAQRFNSQLGFYSCTVSTIDQLVLARFIESGNFERHLNRMRSHYKVLRNQLVSALQNSSVGSRLVIKAADSGLHFLLGILCASEAHLVEATRNAGVPLTPLSAFCMNCHRSSVPHIWDMLYPNTQCKKAAGRTIHPFVVNYAGIPQKSIPAAVEALEKVIQTN